MNKKTSIGGQAVIEGVMIRGQSRYVVSVRKNNKILAKKGSIGQKKFFLLRLPVFRGFVNLLDMAVIGIRSLMWSSEQASLQDGKEKNGVRKEKKQRMWAILLPSIAIAVLFFVGLPYFLTSLLGIKEEASPLLFNIVDGFVRIAIFVIYVVLISFMQDVRILFQYHGAEHKAIHCYEKGEELSVKNVRKFTTIHPRCGTSFLIIVFMISIAAFSLMPSIIKYFFPGFISLNIWQRKSILVPLRILMIPLIAGISYEILKLSDIWQQSLFFRIISMPGLLLQSITTKEPDYKQIEVAINSVQELLKEEEKMKKK